MIQYLNAYSYLRITAFLVLFAAATVSGRAHAGFQEELSLGDQKLSLVGSGSRKKAFIGVYDAALYLPGPADAPERLVAQDKDMAVSILITSRLISAKRLSSALQDGFHQATGGDTAAIESEIARFQTAFASPVGKGDRFDLVYSPDSGLQVFRNGKPDVVVAGLAFKQALFAIWLGPDPVQKSLKQAMLGR